MSAHVCINIRGNDPPEISTCNWLDLESLESQVIMPNKLPTEPNLNEYLVFNQNMLLMLCT